MQPPAITHYENFPVASWLCPPALRAPIAAIYHFARTADDLADEGQASPEQRLADLAEYRSDLVQGQSQRWPQVFAALSNAIAKHQLPPQLLHHLLDAFEQDVRHTASGHRYANHTELLAYCAKSANPVGRLLLHLYGIQHADVLANSDAVCSALQLINFWQDLSQDLARQRFYLPLNACEAHGLSHAAMLAHAQPGAQVPQNAIALIASEVQFAATLMRKGQKIVHQVPGRAGWELRAVVQGGLALCRRIEGLGHNTWQHHPKLRKRDMPGLLWRSLLM